MSNASPFQVSLAGWTLVGGYSIPLTKQRFEFYMIEGFANMNMPMAKYVERIEGPGLYWVQGEPTVAFNPRNQGSWPVICNYYREGDPDSVRVQL